MSNTRFGRDLLQVVIIWLHMMRMYREKSERTAKRNFLPLFRAMKGSVQRVREGEREGESLRITHAYGMSADLINVKLAVS